MKDEVATRVNGVIVWVLAVCRPGGGSQGGSGCDGAGRPAFPAHRTAHNSRYADPGQNDPVGGLRPAPVAEVLQQTADSQ